MTVQEVANRLVELCRADQQDQAVNELYAPDAWSIEPEGGDLPSVQGLDQFAKKGELFMSQIEQVNSIEVTDPIIAENFFTIGMSINVDLVNGPKNVQMNELCIYEVRDGKIVKEEFRYPTASTTVA